MPSFPDFIAHLLRAEKLLEKLTPTEPLDWEWPRRIREADDAKISGGATIASRSHFALVRGGLLYAVDALDPAHEFFQDDHSDLGSYWHGVMHRREGDFDNARYWFRRAGAPPFFAELHRATASLSPDMAKQTSWDPYLFTGQCEQARHGAEELLPELRALQRTEFDVIFGYCWRKAVA
jgi:hypothetical protein